MDQGLEFTSRAFLAWTTSKRIRHILNHRGKPTQNAYIESFNGRLRDECLNEHWFETLAQARSTIASWRVDYNEARPHSSCGPVPPAKFASLHRQQAADTARTQNSQE
jgi:putative transposase